MITITLSIKNMILYYLSKCHIYLTLHENKMLHACIWYYCTYNIYTGNCDTHLFSHLHKILKLQSVSLNTE